MESLGEGTYLMFVMAVTEKRFCSSLISLCIYCCAYDPR